MIEHADLPRWTPLEHGAWMRFAHGRQVMLSSEGGTLRTVLAQSAKQASLTGRIEGRMLLEAYCNKKVKVSKLITNEIFDISLELPRDQAGAMVDVELQFIPATFGIVQIARDVILKTPDETTAPPLATTTCYRHSVFA